MATDWKVISTHPLTSKNRITPPERLWDHITSGFYGNQSISHFSFDENRGLGMITNWEISETDGKESMGYSTFEGRNQLALSQKLVDTGLRGAEKGDVVVLFTHEELLRGNKRGTYIGREESVCQLLPHYDDIEISESNTRSSSETN